MVSDEEMAELLVLVESAENRVCDMVRAVEGLKDIAEELAHVRRFLTIRLSFTDEDDGQTTN